MNADLQIPVVQLHELTKTYRMACLEVRAVRGISLEIRRGEFVAIMGASGSGKSTLMNILGCLDQPTTGSFRLDGTDLASLGRRQLSILRNEKLGFVFQSFHLLPRATALENVELPMFYSQPYVPLRIRLKRAKEALRKVGLADRQRHSPNELSGGQQQRIAIARALVNQPQIVLADEPTGNLDSRTGIEIMGIFQELNDSGITIVMVTHELDIAAYCKRIVVLRDGQILSDTPNAARLKAKDERSRLDRAEQAASLS